MLKQRVIEAWLTSEEQVLCHSEAIISLPLTDEPETMRLVVHRDLYQQPVSAGLVTGLSAQHQQQPIQLESP